MLKCRSQKTFYEFVKIAGMKKFFKKSLVLICSVAILLGPVVSGCGKKAPPKPPTQVSGEQNTKKP